ncbi:MAG: GNAT family N-acetyltransferase [Miltoncostaeaceae bacterium]
MSVEAHETAVSVTLAPSPGAIADEWGALVRRTGASPFAGPWWLLPWADTFADGDLTVLAARRAGRLVGVLAVRLARGRATAPANVHSPEWSAVAEDAHARRALAGALLAIAPGGAELGPMPEGDPLIDEIRAVADARGAVVASAGSQRSPALTLTGVTEPMVHLSTKMRSRVRRLRRRFEEAGGTAAVPAGPDDDLDALLGEAFEVEARQWKGLAGTAIASSTGTERFYRRAAHAAAADGTLRLITLRADGGMVAFVLGIVGGGSYYNLKGGFDPAFSAFSPGHLLREDEIIQAITDGAERYELLGAVEQHKMAWTYETSRWVTVSVRPGTLAGRLGEARRRLGPPLRRAAGAAARRLRRADGDGGPGTPARADPPAGDSGWSAPAGPAGRAVASSAGRAALRRRARGTLAVLRYAEVPERTRLAEHMDALLDRMTPLDAHEAESVLVGRIAAPERGVVVIVDHARREALDRVLPVLGVRSLPAVVSVVTAHLGGGTPFWWDEASDLCEAGGTAGALAGLRPDEVRAALLALPEADRARAMDQLRAGATRAARGSAHLGVEDLRALVAGGLAVAAQTVDHPALVRCDDATVLAQIADSREALAAIVGPSPAWLSYPFGLVDARVASLAARAGVRVGVGGSPGLVRPPAAGRTALSSVAVGAGWTAEELERTLLHLAAPGRARG